MDVSANTKPITGWRCRFMRSERTSKGTHIYKSIGLIASSVTLSKILSPGFFTTTYHRVKFPAIYLNLIKTWELGHKVDKIHWPVQKKLLHAFWVMIRDKLCVFLHDWLFLVSWSLATLPAPLVFKNCRVVVNIWMSALWNIWKRALFFVCSECYVEFEAF